MSLDSAAIAKIARLARIRMEGPELDHYAKELNGILTWIEQLQAVNTDGVPMVASVSDTALPWRKDEVTDGHCRDAILANAPKAEHGCFAVPKVIE